MLKYELLETLEPNQRVQAVCQVTDKVYGLKKGNTFILGSSKTVGYHTPSSCYAYDLKTGHLLGCYPWKWFDSLQVFDSFSAAQEAVTGKTEMLKTDNEGDEPQLSLF